ncbi:MAG: ATPase, T2SS/T4P/T4SS family [Phascolarctobacterium faecium]
MALGQHYEDPDVILVGEMRDTETIATAITATKPDILFGNLHTQMRHRQ